MGYNLNFWIMSEKADLLYDFNTKNNNQKFLPIAELGQYQYLELLCSACVTPAPVALLGCFSPFFLLLKCDSAEECRMHVSELMQNIRAILRELKQFQNQYKSESHSDEFHLAEGNESIIIFRSVYFYFSKYT